MLSEPKAEKAGRGISPTGSLGPSGCSERTDWSAFSRLLRVGNLFLSFLHHFPVSFLPPLDPLLKLPFVIDYSYPNPMGCSASTRFSRPFWTSTLLTSVASSTSSSWLPVFFLSYASFPLLDFIPSCPGSGAANLFSLHVLLQGFLMPIFPPLRSPWEPFFVLPPLCYFLPFQRFFPFFLVSCFYGLDALVFFSPVPSSFA